MSGNKTHRDEGWLALKLAKAMADAKRNGTTAEAWDEQWKMVYTLADSVCCRFVEMASGQYAGFCERLVPRF